MPRALLTQLLTLLATFTLCGSVSAQVSGIEVGVPPVGGVLGDTTDRLSSTIDRLDESVQRQARTLLRARERTLGRLLRGNRDTIERDARGNLARRGELVAIDLADAERAKLQDAGFTALGSELIDGLDIRVTRLRVPDGMELAEAEALAARLAPQSTISPDNLHFPSGERIGASAITPVAIQSASRIGIEVGMIDGSPGASVPVLVERGFARGAPRPSDHGSAVASLLRGAGVTRIRVADVYGEDPAGGNALAIARALGWLTQSGTRVVTISLVGPRNALLERAVREARARGIVIVAAVGNDGPAAPPAYPASYDGVIAVTGVDRRNRALIEAGRALHLDYSAPGDRVYALDARGRTKSWRGTSFATPLVAARIAAALERGANWRRIIDAEARDLGERGPDDVFGRGLLCEGCARRN